jgi:hypothetical protein
MNTAFPATPQDVAVLTVREFTFDLDQLDGHRVPSLERVCRIFLNDANRALVWWIRFDAFRTWCARTDVNTRATSGASIARDACEQDGGLRFIRWHDQSVAYWEQVATGPWEA